MADTDNPRLAPIDRQLERLRAKKREAAERLAVIDAAIAKLEEARELASSEPAPSPPANE